MEFRIWVEVRLAGRILHKQLVAQGFSLPLVANGCALLAGGST